MTAEVMNEMLSVHPKAIALNAVELGLLQRGDEISLKSLCAAILKRQKDDNLTDTETRKLAYSLFSIEASIAKISLELIPFSDKELKQSVFADSLSFFALGFFALFLLFVIFK